MTETAVDELPKRFSLVAGGGFHSLLGRFGLLEDDQLPSYGAAVLLAVVAWSIPAVLVIIQSLTDDAYSGWDYFQDSTVYCRYLIAILVMVATERMADNRVASIIRHFDAAQVLHPTRRAEFVAAVRAADERSSSGRAELIILIFTFLWSVTTTRMASVASVDNWEGALDAGGVTMLSWAGDGSAATSNALFLFLMLRWIWRFLIWAWFLRKASRLDLEIMPVHPDRCGGLGFLGIFPGIFSGLVFALSSVVAASFYKVAPLLSDSSHLLWLAVFIWLLLVTFVFIGPLLFFVRPMYMAREHSLLEYGRLAHNHHLVFHNKWVKAHRPGEEMLGSDEPSALADLNACVQAVHEMRTLPIDRPALVQLLLSAGIPMLLMAALMMPFGELLKLIMGVLF